MSSPRRPTCPAAFELEAFFAGEPSALAPHVASCASCRADVDALKAGSDAFTRARPPELFLRQLERRAAEPRRRSLLAAWLAPLAACAGAAVLLVTALREQKVTLKGHAFHVLVKRGDAAPAPVQTDARLAAGDALRFRFEAPREGHLAILDLDGTERVTMFYPTAGARAAPVRPGDDPLLPGSIVLDAAPGPEWLVAVFSSEPLDIAALAAELVGQSRRPRLEVSCPRCQVETLRIQKGAP
jgi:hypothetical protein